MTDYKQLCSELLAWADKTSAHYYAPPEVLVRARAALAQSEPEGPTPADGEVAEVVRWLRSRAGIPASPDFPAVAAYLTRAADLLAQRYPQPVPVSERLPGPEDCDEEGRCWIGSPEYTFPMGDTGHWGRSDSEWCLEEPPEQREAANSPAVWLPAHALPTPDATND